MEKFKKIWFLLLLTLLFLPMMQTCFHLVDEKPLGGAFVEAKKPVVTLHALYSETAQDSLMNWCTEQTGFHKSMIRLNNQLLFSAFGRIPNKDVVKGKDGNTFFMKPYIDSYTGKTYLGKEKIQRTTRQLKLIQDMLSTKGVSLLPVFVVGKASYYSELIPDEYLAHRHETNNYEEYLRAFDEQGVEAIDFNRWLYERKDTENQAIYCNLSTHWTVYAASLAMDSLVRYMESKNRQKQVHAIINDFDSTYLMVHDDEIYRLMNLILPMRHNTIGQPRFSYTEGYKPKVLAISDSYWWVVFASEVSLHQNLFSEGGYWYYNKTIFPQRTPVQNVESINYLQEIESQEFVLLVCTESTNDRWPYNFIEHYLYSYDNVFLSKQPNQYDAADSLYSDFRKEQIATIIQRIKENPEWLEKIRSIAEEKGIALEQMLGENANYTYRTAIMPND